MRLILVHYVNHRSGYPGSYSTTLLQIFIFVLFFFLVVTDLYFLFHFDNDFAPLANAALSYSFSFKGGLIAWLIITQM
jgi:hypothetical protein